MSRPESPAVAAPPKGVEGVPAWPKPGVAGCPNAPPGVAGRPKLEPGVAAWPAPDTSVPGCPNAGVWKPPGCPKPLLPLTLLNAPGCPKAPAGQPAVPQNCCLAAALLGPAPVTGRSSFTRQVLQQDRCLERLMRQRRRSARGLVRGEEPTSEPCTRSTDPKRLASKRIASYSRGGGPKEIARCPSGGRGKRVCETAAAAARWRRSTAKQASPTPSKGGSTAAANKAPKTA